MNDPFEQTPELPLNAQHLARGATMIERDGWLLPANFGDWLDEYRAVRDGRGAGLFDLSYRGRIEVSGAESVQFLNGMITNDVAALEENAWMLTAFPNVQGRLVAFARVLKLGQQRFLFDTEAATHAAVLKNLQRFTLAGDFRVTDRTREVSHFSVQGAASDDIIRLTFGEDAANVARHRVLTLNVNDAPLHIIRATHTAEDGFDIIISTVRAAALYDELLANGARPVGLQAFETLRIEAGIPRYGVDLTEQNVVLEAGLDEAVSYTKGCYIGQEIIARIHWRGHAAKQLVGVEFESEEPVAAGTTLIAASDGKEAGRITSATLSPALKRTIAIAMLRYAYLAPETEVQIVTGKADAPRHARVRALPFVRGSWQEIKSEG